MADQQWWVQTDVEILGPMPPTRLKQMVAKRLVQPDTQVSLDGEKWVSARKIRGLFADDAASSAPPDAPGVDNAVRRSERDMPDPQENPSAETGIDLEAVLPLIRIRRNYFTTEILVLYSSHVLYGSRNFTDFQIKEEMCLPAGEEALADQCQRVYRIDYSEIEFVREELPFRPSGSSGQQFIHRFQFQGEQQRLRFKLPDTQVGHVREFLRQRLAGRYQWRKLRALWRAGPWHDGVPSHENIQETASEAATTVVLVIFGLVCLVMVGIGASIFTRSPIYGGALFATGLFGAGYSLYALLFSEKAGGPGSSKETSEDDGDVRVKQPIRSVWGGWALKVLGLLYWGFMVSRYTDGIFNVIDKLGPTAGVLKLILWYPSALFAYFGYRLCQKPFCYEEDDESRKPVLFLRPFHDDANITLQPSGTLPAIAGLRGSRDAQSSLQMSWQIDPGATGKVSVWSTLMGCHLLRLLRMVFDRDVATSEELLVRFFEDYGPVVAIGKPREGLATPGARRMYVAHESWQKAVRKVISEAQMIVIQPGRTAGVHWELKQIRKRVLPKQVLLCMVSFWREPQAYEELIELVRNATGTELPRVIPFLRTPAFIYFWNDWEPKVQAVSYKCPLLWPFTLNAVDLDYSLRPFLRGVRGGDRPAPRKPNWVGGSQTAVVSFLSLFVAVVVMLAPPIAARWALDAVETSVTRATMSWTIIRGRALPYSMSIPSSFTTAALPSPQSEHVFVSADSRIYLTVAVTPNESIPTMMQQLLSGLQNEPAYSQVALESTSTVEVAGVQWTESQFRLQRREDGLFIRMRIRAHGDERGMLMLQTMESLSGDSATAQIVEQILASVKLEKPATVKPQEQIAVTSADKIVGRWQSTDAPVKVIQEFTRDGRSKIVTMGTTTVGVYTLNGDVIHWTSGFMRVNVRIKFFSATEMELSLESGERVRYKKIGNL